MNLQEMTNEQLLEHVKNALTPEIEGGDDGNRYTCQECDKWSWTSNIDHVTGCKTGIILEQLESRLCAPKQPYQIKYKFMPNDRDIDDMKALTVWGTSPLAARQTLVDANNWRGQDMVFKVDGEFYFWLRGDTIEPE